MSAAVAPRAAGAWVVSPAWDLCFLTASPLLIVPLVSLSVGHVLSPGTLALGVFAFATFGHHLPGYMRAYGDRELFRRFRARFLLAPPLVFAAVLLLMAPRRFGLEAAPFRSLDLLLLLWGTWHGLMQVYGLMRIYDAKRGGPSARGLDMVLCLWLFGAGLVYSDARLVGLLDLVGHSGLPLPDAIWCQPLRAAMALCGLSVALAWGGHAWRARRAGRAVGLPKLAVALSGGGIYAYTGQVGVGLLVGIAMFEVYHALQYYGIVWIFNRRLRDKVGRDFGPLGFLFRDRWSMVALYSGSIALFGAGFLWLGVPGNGPLAAASSDAAPLFAALFVTSSLLHYYYDGFIWKLRDRQTLKPLSDSWQAATSLSVPGLLHAGKWAAMGLAVAFVAAAEHGRPVDEAAHLRSLAAVAPEMPELLARRIAGALAAGESEEALALARKRVALRPGSAFAWRDLGRARLAASDPAAAAEAFEAALRIAPDDTELLLAHARSLAATPGVAVDEVTRAFRAVGARLSGSDPPLAERELAAFHAARDEPAAAAAALAGALRRRPDDAELRLQVVTLLGRAGAHPRALALARAGVERAPGSTAAQHALGTARLAAGRARVAAEPLELAYAAAPERPGLALAVARARLATGELATAEAALVRAREESANAAVWLHLARVYARTGRLSEASAARHEFVSSAPNAALGRQRFDEILATLGEAELAARIAGALRAPDVAAAPRPELKVDPRRARALPAP